jgi:SAM-dependent methyltransferase
MNEIIQACRACGGTDLHAVLDLGNTPLADRLLTGAMLDQPEPIYPLSVCMCATCSLMQIAETVAPEQLFCEDYPYYSSFSPALLEHSRQNAEELIATRQLGADSLVVELASNDGYMLKNFQAAGIPVLGIDPAEGPANTARSAGIETMCTFFTRDLAQLLRDDGKTADVIIANNVLAHVPDLNGFVAGIATLLKDDGVAVIECPYVRDLIDHCEFDTIYHEHLCYFSVTALSRLFARHGLSLNHVKRLTIHGGSLRLFVEKTGPVGPVVEQLLAEERELGMAQPGYYKDFAKRVDHIHRELPAMLRGFRSAGKRIAAYGAAAKGATLINSCNIGTDLVEYVVDRNTHKQGCHMPGMHQPIFPVERLVETMPDYVLLLAWNFADEIAEQQAEYLQRGGTFIKPVPTPTLITHADVAAVARG